MDRTRFPATAAYLDGMPLGADSFPEHLAKASLYRTALKDCPLTVERGALPDPVVDLIERPVPVSEWIPEARQRAILHAILDDHFRGDRDRFRRWVYDQNRALFASPLYRILMIVVSPKVVVRGVETRWGTFHKGIAVKAYPGENGGDLVMTFPVGLVDEIDCFGHAESFRAAIDAAGARDGTVEVVDRKSTEARFRIHWS